MLKKPSKKIIYLAITAFVLVATIALREWYVGYHQSTGGLTPVETAASQSVSKGDPNNLDSDGDGLPDWQEVMLHTDPMNPDTDGDGTSDGQEVALGRDPNVAGPNDKMTQDTTASNDATTTDNFSATVTKQLFANGLYLSDNGQVTEDNVNTLVTNLMSQSQNAFTFKQYDATGLNVITNPTKDDLVLYAKTLATLQYNLLNQLALYQDPATVSKIYADHAKKVYSLRVPTDVVDDEIKIVNNFSKVAEVYNALANQEQDPLRLPMAIKAYQDAGAEQPLLIEDIGQYLNKNGIIDLLSGNAKNYWILSISSSDN